MGKIKFAITLKNSLEDLHKVEEVLDRISDHVCCSHKKICETNLIIEELFTNIVNHGFNDEKEHTIKLTLTWDNTFLTIRIEDDGKPFNPMKAAMPDTKCVITERLVGGLGIHLIKHFIDVCRYSRQNGKNIVLLQKKMKGGSKNRNVCFFHDNTDDDAKARQQT